MYIKRIIIVNMLKADYKLLLVCTISALVSHKSKKAGFANVIRYVLENLMGYYL